MRKLLLLFALVAVVAGAHRAQTIKGSARIGGGGGVRVIIPSNVFRAFQGVAYSSQLSAQGGSAPFTFAKISGAFPSGIADVTSTGAIAGTPTGTTQGCETVTATDSHGKVSAQTQICITPGAPVSITILPASPSVNTLGTMQLQAIMLWNIPAGQTTLDITNISVWTCPTGGNPGCGTVSALGVFTASNTAGAADPTATFDSINGTTTVTVTSTAPQIITSSLTAAQLGQPYPSSQSTPCITASGGTPPYSFATTSGSLFGLTLNASSGCLSGTANSVGSNLVTFKVTDSLAANSSTPITFASVGVSGVTVSPTTPTINVNSTQQMQATANFTNGTTAPVTQGNTIAPAGSIGCGNASAMSTTSINCPAINLPAGVLLVGQMSCSATAGTFAASDTAINTVVFPNSSTSGPTGAPYFKSSMFYVLNTVANAADVFTLSNGATSCPYWAGNLAWYNISSPTLDQHPAGETNASGSFSNQTNSGPVTTAAANELIIHAPVNGSTNRTWTAVSPLALRIAQPGGQSALMDEIVSAIQSAVSFMAQFGGAADNHISQTLTFSTNGPGATWAISAGNCTVTGNGLVTANGGTSCTVRATYGGQFGFQVITINSPVLQSIAVTPSPSSATVGGSPLQLTATGTYSDSSTQNITTTSNWTSNNTPVATVNSAGLVTPVSAGGASIAAAVGSIHNASSLTVNPATTFTTFFKTSFESNPPSNPCGLNLGPLPGAGDVGSLSNINANSNSPSDTRSTDRSGHTGVAHTGFCSALDFVGTGNNNFPDLEGTLTNGGQVAPELWYRLFISISPTWVDCSQASQPCSNGAQHMIRWWAGDGGHPQFEAGLPVQGDVMQGVASCGNATNPYCTAGGVSNGQDNILGSFRMSTHAGQQVCWEFHMKANTPGQSNGIMEWFVNGAATADGGQYNLNLYGTHVFDGLPEINMGSNLGGSTGGVGYPVNSNYFYVDDVLATNTRAGCS